MLQLAPREKPSVLETLAVPALDPILALGGAVRSDARADKIRSRDRRPLRRTTDFVQAVAEVLAKPT
jgi:hypothetical protein